MWLAMYMKEQITVNAFGREEKLPVSDIAVGCVGCLLVFENRVDARNWVGKDGQILEITIARKQPPTKVLPRKLKSVL